MALLVIMELFTLWFAINTLSSVRAYVEGEGLWSKAQKDAIYQLTKYYRTHDEKDYQAFLIFMAVPRGDHKARLELMKQNPDWEVARQGFLEGRNHPKDIDKMITLFRRFHNISYINKAIRIWGEADPYAEQLMAVGQHLHAEMTSASPSQNKIDAILTQVEPINQQVTKLEDEFSFTLGEGSRWLENLILKLLFAVALTVEISGLLLTFSVSRGIAKGIREIVRASKSIAKGDFTTRAKAYSQDEIGVLAQSFNLMADDLNKQKEIQNHAERELKQQKELYETLVNAQSEMGEGVSITEGEKMIYANPALCKMYGYSMEEILAMPSFINLIAKEDKERMTTLVKERLSGNHLSDMGETAVRTKDGRVINIEYSLKSMRSGNKTQLVSIIRDITEKKKSEEKFKGLLESAPDAMVIINKEGIIQLVNAQTEKLFEYERSELLGKRVEVLVPNMLNENDEESSPHYFHAPSSHMDMGAGLNLQGKKKSGAEFPVEISLSPMETADGLLVSTAIRDITYRKKAEEEIKQKTEELMRSNKELEHFAYVASHDLQEPLRTVTSYVQLLQKRYKDKLTAESNEFINFAVDATARMRALINDLLSYSRVSTQQKQFADVNINDIVKSVSMSLKPSIEKTQTSLTVDELPVVQADETQMRQLFQNLIGNAIKFKSDRKPEIKISARKKDKQYIFSVEDNGIGIAKEYETKIFQLFQRLHDRGKYPGTGIGLAICKKIVELHGGKIWIEENEQKGTTFCFTLKKG